MSEGISVTTAASKAGRGITRCDTGVKDTTE